MKPVLSLLIAILGVFCSAGQAPRGGQIRGTVVDVTGGGVLALIRVIHPESRTIVARARTDRTGVFQTVGLPPGSYNLVAWGPAFCARELSPVVRDGETTDLGKIQLDLCGCESPGVECFEVGPSTSLAIASGYLEVGLGCGVDLDKGKVYCPDNSVTAHTERTSDIRFTLDSSGINLAPLNGAGISAPGLVRPNCGWAKFGDAVVRVVGMGPGIDFCVRTREGRVSHVFFEDDVEPTSRAIRFWYVTNAR